METVRVSSKGQIVIPKPLRTAFHIEPGREIATGLGLLAKPWQSQASANVCARKSQLSAR